MMMKRVFLFQALRCQDLSDAKLVFHVIRAPPTHFPFVRAARLAAPPWAEPVLRGGQWSKAVRLAFELKQPRKLFGVLTEMLDTGFKVPARAPRAALPRGSCGRASVTVLVAGVWDYAPLPSGRATTHARPVKTGCQKMHQVVLPTEQ
jgi:hypothetical protein